MTSRFSWELSIAGKASAGWITRWQLQPLTAEASRLGGIEAADGGADGGIRETRRLVG